MNNEINEIEVAVEEKGRKNSVIDGLFDWAESFVFAVFIVILVFTFILRTVVVVGDSMNPNFSENDRLIITHLSSEPESGDVLVMNSHGLNETIIKRCIGVEGDKIRIDYNTNTVTVNGEAISNDYINGTMYDKYKFNQDYSVDAGVYEYTVPEDKLFVMGDNRNNSSDSRCSEVGFIDEDDVLGKVVFRIYPFDTVGTIKSQL